MNAQAGRQIFGRQGSDQEIWFPLEPGRQIARLPGSPKPTGN